jgi:chromosome segregation ATPase
LDLLKRELVQVQQLTETILKEKENEHKQLSLEQANLKSKLEKKDQEFSDLSAKLSDLNQLDEFKLKCNQLENEKITAEHDFKLQAKLSQEIFDKKLQELEEKLSGDNGKLSDELKRKSDQCEIQLTQLDELNAEKSQLTQNVSELEAKKIELQTKVLQSGGSSENETEKSDQAQLELVNLIKEKETLENELIKLRTKYQSINEDKVKCQLEKSKFI